MNSGDEQMVPQSERAEQETFRRVEAAATGKPAERSERTGQRVAERVVEPLRYLSAHGEDAVVNAETAEPCVRPELEWDAQLVEKEADWQRRLEAARQEALAEGRAQVEGDRTALLRQSAGQLEQAVKDFIKTRDSYFARVEREVVELALAIAARILQREAQVDPLLLAGAVRVALGQLSETTTVELHVPAAAHEMWSETLRLMPNLPVVPSVVADSERKAGECVLTTEVGRVDLGVQAQLKEIERGFFDLLSHRTPSTGREQSRAGL